MYLYRGRVHGQNNRRPIARHSTIETKQALPSSGKHQLPPLYSMFYIMSSKISHKNKFFSILLLVLISAIRAVARRMHRAATPGVPKNNFFGIPASHLIINREKILFWHLSVAMPYRVQNDSRCPRWGKKVLLNSEQKTQGATPIFRPVAHLRL